MTSDDRRSGLPINRVEALADGVFAVAMTVLVLGLSLPSTGGSLASRLWTLWPKLASYVLSFVMLGVLWIGHHYQLNHMRRVDRVALWLNLAFLLSITFLPFGAAVLGAEPHDPVAVAFYAGTILLGGLALLWHWSYVCMRPELQADNFDAAIAATLKHRIWFGLAISAAAIAVGFVDTRLALVVLLALPVGYFTRSRIDHKVTARH